MADGGGINIRLSLKGAEQVRAELAKIGPGGSQMARELDRALRQPTAGMKALDVGAKEARTSFENFAAGAGPAGSFLQALGPWGLAAAAGLAAAGLAAVATIRQLREGMAFAAELTDTSDRIGVAAEELQKWRFVSDEAGVAVTTFEANLEKLNGTVGAFKLGIGDAKLKPVFEELGITKDQLSSVDDGLDMMLLLADTLGQVKDRATQVKLAKSMGVEDSLPILRLGSERIKELTGNAESLGLVMSDDVRKGFDDADRAIEIAQQRIDMSLRVAVSGLADDFANVIEAIAQVIVWLTKLNSVKIENPGVVAGQWVNDQARRALGMGPNQQRADRIARQNGWVSEAGNWNRTEVMAGLEAIATPETPGFDPKGHAPKGGGGVNKAEQERQRRVREAERAVESLQREDFDAQREWLREVQAGRDTAADRAQAARLLLNLDNEEARVALDKVKDAITAGGLMTEEVQARLASIELLRADVAAAREKAVADKEARELADAVREGQQAIADIQFDILSLASADAATAAERRDIELQLLDLAQRRQRADLEAAIEAEKEPAKRALLNQALTNLPVLFDAQRNRVRQDNAGPLESWWTKQGKNDASANEWIQGQALDAVDGMNRGLIDAIRNSKDAGEAFKAMGDVAANAMQKVVDGLLEIALQRMLIQPLAGALFGGPGASGGGGLLSGFLGSAVGAIFGGGATPTAGDTGGLLPGSLMKGMARGGVQGARGLVPVGEYGLEVIDMPAGSRVYDVERTERMIRDGAMGGRGGAGMGAAPTFNMPIKIVNNGREPVKATSRQTPEGMEVILEPMVRASVNKMGGDGSLAKAHSMTPKGITR